MGWVQQRKLPPCKAICYRNEPCHTLDDLWAVLHGTYNSASGRQFDTSVLDNLPDQPQHEWALFSIAELQDALSSCSNISTPGPDHLKWRHIKRVF